MMIKTPDIHEYERILDLWEEGEIPYKPGGRDTRANIERELEEQPEYWKGMYHEDRLVGIIVGTDDGRKGWINRLAVDEEYRGKKIGVQLVKELEKEFHDKGLEVIGVLIEGDNPDGMEFFEKLGYEELGIKYYSKRKSWRS